MESSEALEDWEGCSGSGDAEGVTSGVFMLDRISFWLVNASSMRFHEIHHVHVNAGNKRAISGQYYHRCARRFCRTVVYHGKKESPIHACPRRDWSTLFIKLFVTRQRSLSYQLFCLCLCFAVPCVGSGVDSLSISCVRVGVVRSFVDR